VRIRLPFRRRDKTHDAESAKQALHDARHATEALKRYNPHTSSDYATPFDGGQYPGINPGGPF
jgi:hypothetical protein